MSDLSEANCSDLLRYESAKAEGFVIRLHSGQTIDTVHCHAMFAELLRVWIATRDCLERNLSVTPRR